MNMMVFRSPTGDIVVQLSEGRDITLTAVLEREDAEKLAAQLAEKLDLRAEASWKDILPDEELADHVRHQAMGLARGVLLSHGTLDRLRCAASLDVRAASTLHRELGEHVARLKTGRIDKIEPEEDPTTRILEVRKA